jgi:uncharacterized membrane protein YuzA (DUF378 family)
MRGIIGSINWGIMRGVIGGIIGSINWGILGSIHKNTFYKF